MKPLPLQNLFTNGMKRDVARNRMPPNSAWSLKDFILDYGAPARERNGWSYSASSLTASASYVRGGLFATFSPTAGATDKNIVIDEDGFLSLAPLTGAAAATAVSAARTIAQNPIFHGGTAASAATAVYTGLVIIPDATMAAVPKKYDGTDVSDLNGSPPMAKYATVYKDYTVLGHGYVSSTLYPNRTWFSQPGDPDCAVSSATAWDTTDSWIDFSLPIIALASTKNVMLVFGDGQIARVRGSIPPPDSDMVNDDPWQKLTLLDAFSITEYQDQVYFCAQEGVFRTDGVSVDDITLKGGMLRYWLDLVQDATSTWTFTTGIIRNKLFIAVMDGSTLREGFMIDLSSYAWTQMTNLPAVSMWTGQQGQADELYFAIRDEAKSGRMSTIFEVDDADYKSDADGTAVTGVLETPFYELGRPGIKNVKAVHIGYELVDYAEHVGYEINGDFELDTTLWAGSNATIARVTDESVSGMASLEVTATTAFGAAVHTPSSPTLTQGTTYRIGAWLKGEGQSIGKQAHLQLNESGGAQADEPVCASSDAVTTLLTDQWQWVEAEGSINQSDRTSLYLFVQMTGVGTASGDIVYMDAVELIEVGSGDSPEIEVGYVSTPEERAYVFAEDNLAANGLYNRVRVPVGGRMYGIGLRFRKTAAGDFSGFDISAEVGFQEESKRIS